MRKGSRDKGELEVCRVLMLGWECTGWGPEWRAEHLPLCTHMLAGMAAHR